MGKFHILAGACAAAITLSGCSGVLTDEEQDQVIADVFAKSSGLDSLGDLYKELTFQFFQQISASDAVPAEQLGKWADEAGVRQEIDARYAEYIDDLSAGVIADFRTRLNTREVTALKSVLDDEAKMTTVTCAAESKVEDWDERWSACTTGDAAALDRGEMDAYKKLVDMVPDVVGSPTSLTYFGGTTCKLFADYAQDVSRDGFTLTFDELELNLGSSEKVDCEVLRDRLVDLRVENNPGKLIVR